MDEFTARLQSQIGGMVFQILQQQIEIENLRTALAKLTLTEAPAKREPEKA